MLKKTINKTKNRGFSLIELIVVIAILAVLAAVLVPALIQHVEMSRMQRDESAMDEVVNAVNLALVDPAVFDEIIAYSIKNNFMTYTDSSGQFGKKTTDEEFWAPDGCAPGVTITFNPDKYGHYNIADGIVNDMTKGNGSIGEERTAQGDYKTCKFSEMGNKLLYNAVSAMIGEKIAEKSATYKNSSYTVFIRLTSVNGEKHVEVYGQFNGTNLSESSTAAVVTGTSDYKPDSTPTVTRPGGSSTPNYDGSSLSGSGSIHNPPSTNPTEPSNPSQGEPDTNPSGGNEQPNQPENEQPQPEQGEQQPGQDTPPQGNQGQENQEHQHNYSQTVIKPTCTQDGYTQNMCSCGDNFTSNIIKTTGHKFSETVIPPTTTAQGYTIFTCSACGYSYKDNYVNKLPINVDEGDTSPVHFTGYGQTTINTESTGIRLSNPSTNEANIRFKFTVIDAETGTVLYDGTNYVMPGNVETVELFSKYAASGQKKIQINTTAYQYDSATNTYVTLNNMVQTMTAVVNK